MTDAERRDQSLRTVELPDCCGNCVKWRNYRSEECPHVERGRAGWIVRNPDFNQVCGLHERREG